MKNYFIRLSLRKSTLSRNQKRSIVPMSNTDRLLNSAVHKRQNYDQIQTVVSIFEKYIRIHSWQ